MYFSHESIGPLTHVILSVVITWVLFKSRLPHRAIRLLIGFFSGLTFFLFCYFAESMLEMPWRLLAAPIGLIGLLVGQIFLAQAPYHFPAPHHPREARWVLWISIGLALVGSGLVFYFIGETLAAHFLAVRNVIDRLLQLSVVEFLWPVLVLIRQARQLPRPPTLPAPRGWRDRFAPASKDERGARAFGGVAGLGGLLVVFALFFNQARLYYPLFDTGLLVTLFLFVLTWFNHVSEAVSFMTKLTLSVLVMVLITLGLVGHIMMPPYLQDYDARRQLTIAQVLSRLDEPAANLNLTPLPSEVGYLAVITHPGQTPFDDQGYTVLYSRQAGIIGQTNPPYRIVIRRTPPPTTQRITRVAFDLSSDEQYLAYLVQRAGRSYEIGFDWRPYRDYVHAAAAQLAYLILGSTAFILFIFPAFLRANLAQPLQNLLTGVHQMETGQFVADVEILYEDEIGSLTRSFNSMAHSLRESQHYKDALNAELRYMNAELQQAMTERARAEQLLIRAERLAAAGKLAASIAHEINNPLQSLVGCLALAREALAEGRPAEQYLEVVQEAVNRLATTVGEMRDFYQPRTRERRWQDVNGLIESVLVLSRKKCVEQRIDLHWQPAPALPPVLVVSEHLQQVFLNLLLNAVEAMPHGGVLRIATSAQNGAVRITFTDTGLGIPAEDLDDIFEPFYTTKDKGLGLGLSVSFTLVEAQHGRIEVASTLGRGTTFTVSLPITDVNAQPVHLPSEVSLA